MLTRREFIRRSGAVGLLAASGGLLAACGGGSTTTSSSAASGGSSAATASAATASAAATTTASSGPVTGGTLTIMIPSNYASINPVHEADWDTDAALLNMFDPMLTYDNQLKPRGLIATSWKASADGKTFTFKIRPNMKFQDGTVCDANAIKANIAWYQDPKNKSPLAGNFFGELDHVTAPDASTFTMVWKEPRIASSVFPEFLFGPLIASPKAFANASAFNTHPVGSGPFMFDKYVADNHLSMKRFDGYWAGKPYLDAVDAKIVTDQSTQRDELLAGTADVMLFVTPTLANQLKGSKVKLSSGPNPGEQMLSINLNNKILADVNVRKAMAYALNKPAMIQKVLYGYAVEAVALVIPSSPGFDKSIKGYSYDPKKAASILDAAGWKLNSSGVREKNGQELSLTMATQSDPTWLLICQVVQQELKQVGIKVSIAQTDWATFLNNMRAGKYDIAYWSLGGFSFSSIGYTANLLSTQYWNVSQITKNPAFKSLQTQMDTTIKAAQSELDTTKRHQLMAKFQQTIISELPVIPLWHNDSIRAIQPWVHGLEAPTEFSICRAEKAWKSKTSA